MREHTPRDPDPARHNDTTSSHDTTSNHTATPSHTTAHDEAYSQWTIVNVVFGHLVEQGLHPTLGDHGDPGEQAANLLRALGVTPAAEGDPRIQHDVHQELAQLRAVMMGEQ